MNREKAAVERKKALRKFPGQLLLSVLGLCLLAVPAPAADWPLFMGNEGRTGHALEQAAPPLTKAWEFTAPGGTVSGPVIYDGRVYFGTRGNKLYALDAATGALLWERLTAGWVDSSPAVHGGVVYATCRGGRLYAVDRLSGAPLWIVDLGAPSASSPLVRDGRVYVGTGSPESKLKVYDAATGAPLGSYQAAQPVDSAPSADGDYIYFGSNDGNIHALGALTLAPRWAAYSTLGSFGQNAVAVSSGALYALPGRDEKSALSRSLTDWSQLAISPALTKTGPWTQAGSPVFDGTTLFFVAGAADDASEDGARLAALSSATLSAVWPSSRTLGGVSPVGVLASPAMANEMIFAATPAGRLLVVSSSGVQLEDLDLSGAAYASPAVSNGLVVAANFAGKVTGFRAGRHVAISRPAAGEILRDTVAVYGYFDSPDLAGYELEYSTGGETPLWTRISSAATASPAAGAALSAWDVSGLENGLYTLRLRTLESSPSGYDGSAQVPVRLNAAPLPPSGLTAADVPADNGNAITLAWSASPSPGVSSYRVYRDEGYGPSLLATTAGLSYIDSTAVTGTTFAYAVSAWDGWVESAQSAEAEAFSVNNSGDNVPPAAVADLAAEPGPAPGSASLTWTAPGNDGDVGEVSHYLLKFSTDPGQAWAAFDSLPGSSSPAGGPAGITEDMEAGGLLGGVTYYFAIKAVDPVGNVAALSNVASAWGSLDYVPPAPPAALAVADAPGDEGGSLVLSWYPSPDDGGGAGDVYGYRIYRRGLGGSYVSSAPYASVAAGAVSYTDTAAALNVRYYYSVAAFDSTNNSALSAEASGVSADNWRFFDASRGGVVRLADGMEVEVPGASASQNDKIMVTRLDPVSYAPLFRARAATPANPTNIVYQVRFQNPATRLVAPALIHLPYTDADVAGMQTENLRVYTLTGGAWVMLNTSSVDAAAKKVSAEVSHFSVFRVMEYVPSGALFADDEVYTYPNPARGDTVTFKFRVAHKAYVRVEVFNVAGEKVASLAKADCPAGQASEIAWDVRGIASGVYVYRLEAQSSVGNKSVTKKLAVIH
ncbi:MAG: PQQ-binding-like beta-propeller repeat protein [Elusimicrobiales bacterium]